MAKLGVATQLLAPGDIFQALQLGTLDATEFSLPVMDQKLGFHQVAKFYYFPGWHQQATFLEFYINRKKWDALSDAHKAIIELACGDLTREVIAEGEATQWRAMTEMRDKHGVQIKQWGPEFMAAFEKAWNEGDTRKMSALLAEDAHYINPMGEEARGQQEIESLLVREKEQGVRGESASLTLEDAHVAVARLIVVCALEGDWQREIATFDRVLEQAVGMADGLSDGIAQQFGLAND
jgi:ketosteroid isomerase-like protein